MEEVINGILIREVETKNIMTKSSLPVGGYSVNPYVGCTHACKYGYSSFMKRFTGHKEEWGTFLDVKHIFIPYDRDKVFLHKHRNAELMCLVRQRPCPFRLRMNLPALSSGHGADNDPIDSGKVNCAGIIE